MKLTKTEQEVLANVFFDKTGMIAQGHGQKRSGAKYNKGRREVNALKKLEQKGIIKITNVTKFKESTGDGNSILWLHFNYKVI